MSTLPDDDRPVAPDRVISDTSPPPPRLAPTTAGERIQVVDALRGFAVLGILVVNMMFFAGPFYAVMVSASLWPEPHDRVAEGLIAFFATMKFYSLFSFLFGFGMAMQLLRAEGRGRNFVPTYVRRLLILLLIGAVHGVLLWAGDILMAYAVLGFVLLLFRNCRPKTLLIWAVIFLLLPLLLTVGIVGLIEVARHIPQAAAKMETAFAQQEPLFHELIGQSIAAYSSGSFGEIMRQRLSDLRFAAPILVFNMAPNILCMFLLGLYAGRRGVLHNISGHLGFIRRVAIWGAVLGVIGNAVVTFQMMFGSQAVPSPLMALAGVGAAVGAPAFCFCYAATLILLWQNESWRRRLSPLAAVGRMALTNYLLHSVICTTIFYSYGLGLYGGMGPARGLALTFAIYLAQIPLSNWWLAHFRFGPMEWLWRSLTYMKWQPLRITRPMNAG